MPGELTHYQNDPRWKDKPLGLTTDAGSTIGLFGCLLTSLTMVANALGADETPDSLNEKLKAAGAFQGPWVRAHLIGSVLPGVRYARAVECRDTAAPLAEIDASLAAGQPVIVQVDYSPDPGVQDHWIVIYAKQGDDYLIRDPWQGAKSSQTLVQKYGHAGGPADIINRVIWLAGQPAAGASNAPPPAAPAKPASPAPQPSAARSAPPPAAGDALEVVTLTDQLTLRAQPQIADHNVLRRYAANTRLRVLEPAAAARSKIGQTGQWLKVQDIEGQAGYVAAWYVTPAEAPALGPRPAVAGPRADPVAHLVVRTTAEGVVLRTAARVAPDTQLKLLPPNAELLVIETGDAAPKIGQPGQWLHVRDLQGAQGFVAAWFVRRG